jgi:hypothetical protein
MHELDKLASFHSLSPPAFLSSLAVTHPAMRATFASLRLAFTPLMATDDMDVHLKAENSIVVSPCTTVHRWLCLCAIQPNRRVHTHTHIRLRTEESRVAHARVTDYHARTHLSAHSYVQPVAQANRHTDTSIDRASLITRRSPQHTYMSMHCTRTHIPRPRKRQPSRRCRRMYPSLFVAPRVDLSLITAQFMKHQGTKVGPRRMHG